nr:4Fe-4S ferredoxin [Desulfobacterales bacterium]
MKVKRKIIEIDDELCDGCGECVPACAEGAIQVIDGKARLVAEKYCDGLGACLGECPNGAITIVEREADDFDEEAVAEYLREREEYQRRTEATLACGCPSTQVQTFIPRASQEDAMDMDAQAGCISRLSHWPIQIRLVPSGARFLKGADLLVLADCVSVAYPMLHRDFLPGRVVMMGCPKFDDVDEYIRKFGEIFKTAGIERITVAHMEVPCCSGLPMIVERGMGLAGKTIPMEEVVISARGETLKREKSAV